MKGKAEESRAEARRRRGSERWAALQSHRRIQRAAFHYSQWGCVRLEEVIRLRTWPDLCDIRSRTVGIMCLGVGMIIVKSERLTPMHLIMKITVILCVLWLAGGGGCVERESNVSNNELANEWEANVHYVNEWETKVLEAYFRDDLHASAEMMETFYEYIDQNWQKFNISRPNMALAAYAARLAMLYDATGDTNQVISALDRCRTHLETVYVRGETDSKEGRLSAKLRLTSDRDKEFGLTWGHLTRISDPDYRIKHYGIGLTAEQSEKPLVRP